MKKFINFMCKMGLHDWSMEYTCNNCKKEKYPGQKVIQLNSIDDIQWFTRLPKNHPYKGYNIK